MHLIGQVLKLKPGCEQEYEKRHDELWPEMAAAMHKAGVSMVIYSYENLLFVHATATDKHSWDELECDPVMPRWDKYMSDVLEDGEHGKPFVKNLRRVFEFGNFS